MERFLLHCSGGLGNRLLGLLSARQQFPKAEVIVYWPTGAFPISKAAPRLDARFEDLYCPLEGFRFVEKPEFEVQRKTDTKYGYSHGALPKTRVEELFLLKSQLHLSVASRQESYKIRDRLKGPYSGCLVRLRGHHKTQAWNPTDKFTRLINRLTGTVFGCCDDPRFWASIQRPVVYASKTGSLGSVQQLITVAAELSVLADASYFYAPPYTAMAAVVQMLRSASLKCDKPIGDWSIINKESGGETKSTSTDDPGGSST